MLSLPSLVTGVAPMARPARAAHPQMALEAQTPPVQWLPGPLANKVTRPAYLDGSLAADVGFDPLGFGLNGLPNGLPSSFVNSNPTAWQQRSNI
eukprot:1418906-Prymnesium_polylepis.1